MGRRPINFNIPDMFMKHVVKNQITKCWEWQPASFRFRVFFNPDSVVLNPRRYCAYIHGYNIRVGKQVTYGCDNPKCVNPEHTVEKQGKRPISKHDPLYLTLEDLKFGSNTARRHYGKPIQEIRDIRARTIELIKRIRNSMSPRAYTNAQVAEKLNIGEHFVYQVRKMTKEYFKEKLEHDKTDTGFVPVDELGEILPDDYRDFL